MKRVLKFRWLILAVWIALALVLTIIQPNIDTIINEKDQGNLSEKYSSTIAKKLLKEMSGVNGDNAIIVFNKESKLDDTDMEDIKKGLDNLKASEDEVGLVAITSHFDKPEAKDQLVSKDGTTVLASITIEKNGRDMKDIQKIIDDKLEDVKVGHSITGEEFVKNDYIQVTFAGVDKSAVITILFILAVLCLVFRSVATPLVSLFTVGVSYLCSMGIVSQLIYNMNFPVTSLTRMFIILVLFGIGTDYNILLFNRFKEELGRQSSIDEAIIETYRTAGKTIMFSSLTVFIAFLSLSLAEFDVYRSACAVAIGILILFLTLITLTPCCMKLLGGKLFWPSHNTSGHKESKVWEKVTNATVKHPVISIVAIIAIMAPVLYFNSQELNFDNLKDIDSSYTSVKGFNTVSEHFSTGKSMPATIVIKSKNAMDNNETLSVIDKITMGIKKIDGVDEVSGPTQPKGTPIEEFYVDKQASTIINGLSSADSGIVQISDGLKEAQDKLQNTPDFSKVNDLIKGTDTVNTGLLKISDALKQIENGINSGANGAETVASGIAEVKKNADVVKSSLEKLSAGYSELNMGYSEMKNNYEKVADKLIDASDALTGMNGLIKKIEGKNPKLSSDEDFVTLRKMSEALSSGLKEITEGMTDLNNGFAKANSGLYGANNGLEALNSGFGKMIAGLEKLETGANSLSDGLKKGNAGQSAVIANMNKLQNGLSQIQNAQKTMTSGLSNIGGSLNKLKDGFGASTDGLNTISSGLNKTNDFLLQWSDSKNFFIPKEAFAKDDFKMALDNFMSKDRKIAKIVVNLSDDPYSKKSLDTLNEVEKLLDGQLEGTVLADAEHGIDGATSKTNGFKTVAENDITKTQIIVLIGVFIVLILVIRSFWIPLYIIISLVAAYFTSITVTGVFAKHVLGMNEISWNVPFFAFVMIVALGVDYSIFLMTRYNEYGELPPHEAIVKAAKNIGGVVVSAAIILAGTFLTLYPSGMKTLMQLAVGVSVGLMMLALILLPVLLPALISLPHVFKKNSGKSQHLSNF